MLTFSKEPQLSWSCDTWLLLWILERPSQWKFISHCDNDLCEYFDNLFNFEFLVKKVEEWGIHICDD